MPGLIAINNITCGYHHSEIIKDIAFEIEKGEFLGIIGPNGSGKSTLLKALSRCLRPFAGSVFYAGSNLYSMPQSAVARSFAFVAQDTVFNFSFSAWEVVLMGRIPYLLRMQEETSRDLDIVRQSMRLTDTLPLAHRQVDELSVGERQMVIIAKALAQEPAVLFLDEPTSHLDIGHQIQILGLLQDLNKKNNLTIVIVLHDLNLASEYCKRVVLLKEGAVFKIGRPEDVLTYQNIEEVYKTLVWVNKNPISGHPHILLINKHR